MQSFWEQTSWLEADLVVVGGGLIGISTAIDYVENNPGKKVVVLERGLVPTGASTRNAGFACFGSVSEIASDIDLMGVDRAREIVQQRIDGLALLRARCKGADIGYHDDGGHEIFLGTHPALERIDEVNACVAPILGNDAFAIRNDLISTYGLSSNVTTLVRTPYEATLDSGKLVRTLWNLASYRGVDIRTGSDVVEIDDTDGRVNLLVQTIQGIQTIAARRVVVAANAWIPGLVQHRDMPTIRPGRGQVIVTTPITNLQLRGSFHFDEGYYYFRNVGDRVLLGGGRNLDLEGEATTSHETTDHIQSALETMLHKIILPKHPDVSIDYRWAGTMAFTATKQPYVGRVSPGVVVAFGCNGMGVALSSSIATSASAIL